MDIQKIAAPVITGSIKNTGKRIVNYAKTAALGLTLSGMPANTVSRPIPIYKQSEYFLKNNKVDSYVLNNTPLIYDNLPLKNMVQQDIDTGKFLRSLRVHKDSLIKDLNISSKKYDEYEELAKIIGEDTSELNPSEDPGCSGLFKMIVPFIPKGMEDFPILAEMYKKYEYKILDMDLLTVTNPSKREQKLCSKYGINPTDDDLPPAKKAIAAIIHIDRLDKSYDTYLKLLKDIRPDTTKSDVKNSINNAKRIVKNEKLLTNAIMQLELSNMFERYNIVDNTNLFTDFISQKDLKDLKIYASTLTLEKKDYIFEVWNGNSVIPKGKNSDRACANILNVMFNK